MCFVYILKDKNNDIYIGYTASLERRLSEHKRKEVYYTSRLVDPELYYYEAYPNEDMAKERERQLKRFGSSYIGLAKRIGLK